MHLRQREIACLAAGKSPPQRIMFKRDGMGRLPSRPWASIPSRPPCTCAATASPARSYQTRSRRAPARGATRDIRSGSRSAPRRPPGRHGRSCRRVPSPGRSCGRRPPLGSASGRVTFVAPKRSISAEVSRWVGDCGLRIYLAIQSSLGEPLEPTWPEV